MSMIENISSAIVRCEASIIDSIQNILNLARAFEENYVLSLADAHVLDIFGHMMAPNFLHTNCRPTCTPQRRVANNIISNRVSPRYF